MARELGGGVPRTRAAPHGDREEMPPSPRAFRAAQVSQGGSPGFTAPGFGRPLGLPRPLPRRAAELGREPVSHPLRPQQLAPRCPPGEFLSHPAARLFPPGLGSWVGRPRLRDGPRGGSARLGPPQGRAGPGQTPRGQPHLSPWSGTLGAGSAGGVDRSREQPEPAGGVEGETGATKRVTTCCRTPADPSTYPPTQSPWEPPGHPEHPAPAPRRTQPLPRSRPNFPPTSP